MSGYLKGIQGSFGSRGVLPSARHTLTDTSPVAVGAMPKTNSIKISFLTIYPLAKNFYGV
jgi:hypothetical protein